MLVIFYFFLVFVFLNHLLFIMRFWCVLLKVCFYFFFYLLKYIQEFFFLNLRLFSFFKFFLFFFFLRGKGRNCLIHYVFICFYSFVDSPLWWIKSLYDLCPFISSCFFHESYIYCRNSSRDEFYFCWVL